MPVFDGILTILVIFSSRGIGKKSGATILMGPVRGI